MNRDRTTDPMTRIGLGADSDLAGPVSFAGRAGWCSEVARLRAFACVCLCVWMCMRVCMCERARLCVRVLVNIGVCACARACFTVLPRQARGHAVVVLDLQ